MEQKLVETIGRSSLQHQLSQNHQHDKPSITQADRCTKESIHGSTEIHEDNLIYTKALMSKISIEQPSVKQQLVENETEEIQKQNQQIKMRDEVLAVQNSGKQTSLTNSSRDIIQEGTIKRNRAVPGSGNNHAFQIIQKNCKEVSNQSHYP